ncbi:MAG: hypothetical protein ACLFUN_02285 [Desulfobacterales bacterium]
MAELEPASLKDKLFCGGGSQVQVFHLFNLLKTFDTRVYINNIETMKKPNQL